VLPIPGTSKVSHLEENIAAAQVRLDDDEIRTLADAVG
jgi:aryl-alcohol dehydrogenase-like predicted oxidoreductase